MADSSDVYEENTNVAFPLVFEDDKDLCTVGVRTKSFFGLVGIKIYAFGVYADCKKLKEVMKPMFEETVKEATEEMYEAAIAADAAMTIKLVIVFGSITMSMVRKIFNQNLRSSIKKLSNSDHGELLQRVLGDVKEGMRLPTGSVIEINKLPGYVLQTKVRGEVISEVESELLCKALINIYLGDEALDPQAREKFGQFLISDILEH